MNPDELGLDDEEEHDDQQARDLNEVLEGRSVRVGFVASFFPEALQENELGIIAAYEAYVERYGSHIASFSDSDTDRARIFDQRAAAFPRQRQRKRLRTSLVWTLSAEQSLEVPSLWTLRANLEREVNSLGELCWTIDAAAESTSGFRGAFLAAARTLPCCHGYGGFGLVQPLHPIAEQASEPDAITVAARFHGIDIIGSQRTSIDAISGIKCVNWLTLLDDSLLAKLGGKAALRNTLSEAIVLHDIPNGVVIQAGAAPVLGDVHEPDELAAYREVALALKPIFAVGPYGEFRAMDGFQQYTNEWRHRFFPGAKWPP